MKYFFGFFLLFLTLNSVAQSAGQNYNVTWVNAENGLKQLSVRYCVRANDGFLWIATELGLYRYDGNRLIEIKDECYPSLSSQRISKLGKDMITGKIYLETNPEQNIYVIDNNKIVKIDSKKFFKNTIFTLKDVCFTDSDSLIKKIFKNVTIDPYLNKYSFNSFMTASLTSNYLYLPQNSKLIAFDKNGLVKNFNLSCTTGLVLLQFGNTILATDKGKVTVIYEGKISTKKIHVDPIIQSYLNRNLMNLSDIEIFGSKNDFFIKYKAGIYKLFYKNDTLSTKFLFASPANDITSIYHLTNDNLYFIGTRTRGMAILKPILFNTILFDENSQNKSINYCYSVIPISNKKWYSASGWSFNPTSLKSKVDNFLIDFRNSRFLLPYKNKFYMQVNNDLLTIENKKKEYDFNIPETLFKNKIGFSGYTYYDKKLVFSDAFSIYFVKNDTLVTDESLNKKFVGKAINGICSVNNNLIIYTIKGVFTYSPVTKKLVIIKGLENVNARYINPIDKSSFWVGCYGEGLFLVKNNTVHKVIDANIDITTAHAVEEDAQGNLWISTNDGLLKTEKASSIKKILKNQPLDCYKYSTEDGLLTNEFNGGGTHPSLQTKEGIIGFPSMKGFVWFKPQKIPRRLFKGQIIIDDLIVDNKKNSKPRNGKYFISNDAEVLTINFSYAYYFNKENLTIAYRFEDQPNWTAIKGTTFQIGRYKKGEHQLLIRISTHGFDKNQNVTQSFLLDFEPKYYETLWFWSFCTILFVLFLYSAYQIGLRLNKRREAQLKQKIEEKTVELQQSLTELANSNDSVLVSLKEKELLLKEVHHRVKNNLQLVMSLLNIQARDNELMSIDDFIEKGQSRITSMVLIHENLYHRENIGEIDFQEYIQSLTQNIKDTFGDKTKNITFIVEAVEIYFDIETAVPLGLICNELITNSMKHAFPDNKKGTILISISRTKSTTYELVISDNGIGKANSVSSKKSLGLELVRLLTMQLKGTLVQETSSGTTYRIIFNNS